MHTAFYNNSNRLAKRKKAGSGPGADTVPAGMDFDNTDVYS